MADITQPSLARPRPSWFRGLVVNGDSAVVPPDYLIGGQIVPPYGDECFALYPEVLDALARNWLARLSPSAYVVLQALVSWTLGVNRSWARMSQQELCKGLWLPDGTCAVAPLQMTLKTLQRALTELQTLGLIVMLRKEGEPTSAPYWYLIEWSTVFEYQPTK